ncbi:hypothetical protein ACQP1P_16565 [Dactylosporangium sp. CA-052675]|uniref:hypothetical protein n=1 Tax=Dactylosporangium sp. CA-052675 TaxID=3239927 RepID=UPI003D9262BF
MRTLRILASAASAATVASVATLGLTTAPAQAAGTCTVTAYAPTYSSPNISARGLLSCTATQQRVEIHVYVYKDGQQKGSGTIKWANNVRSTADTAVVTNEAGNQQWCTQVYGFWDGGGQGYAYTCENNSY